MGEQSLEVTFHASTTAINVLSYAKALKEAMKDCCGCEMQQRL